jgi:N-acetylmuramoyl-L-alanine amidase
VIGSTLVDRVQISPNHEPRWNNLKPSLIVLHYTGMKSGAAAVDWLCNPQSKVSCHYLVDVDGEIVQMVDENHRAWHAGVSSWHGQTDTNSQSIGIEIQNEGHAAGCPAYPAQQMRRVSDLCLDIMARHGFAPHQVIAHSDVAPGRKIDPGEAFEWRKLADQGIGQFVVASTHHREQPPMSAGEAQFMLQSLGYGFSDPTAIDGRMHIVVKVFQQRYRPALVDGVLDPETCNLIWRLFHILPKGQFSV